MNKYIVNYFGDNDELLLADILEETNIDLPESIFGEKVDPFENTFGIVFNFKHLQEMENSVTYIMIDKFEEKRKEAKMIGVVLEYYDNQGMKFKEEVTGAIEGSPLHSNIGRLLNPWMEKEVFNPDDLPYGAEFVVIREVSKYDSILSELKRLSEKERKTLLQRALKLTEETGEVAEAVLSFMDAPGCGYKKKTEDDVVEEAIDVIIMASSIIFHAAPDLNTVIPTLRKKLGKWERNMDREETL